MFDLRFFNEAEMSLVQARIRQERKKRGWTQAKLAELSGHSVQTIGRVEDHNNKNFTIKTLSNILFALDLVPRFSLVPEEDAEKLLPHNAVILPEYRA